MSVTTATPLLVAPAAASALTVTPNASNWVYGAWVQFITSAPGPISIAGVFIGPGSWSFGQLDIDVGIGVGGAQTSLNTPMRFGLGNSAGGGQNTCLLPHPISGMIPTGANVWLRVRSGTGGPSSVAPPDLALLYYVNLDSDISSTYPASSQPLAANVPNTVSSGVAWTNGAWVQIVASLTDDAYIYGLAFVVNQNTGGFDFEFDIGTGGAGAEVAVTTLRGGSGAQAGQDPEMMFLHLPALLHIVAGTRLSTRVRQSAAAVQNHRVAIIYYDAPPTVVPPAPASDFPCTIKTPVVWGALGVAGSSLQFSKQPLRDPSTYYGGYKAPRLVEAGMISRAASDWLTGAWQAQTATVKLSDTDRFFRNLSQPDFLNSSLYLYVVSEVSRLAQAAPKLLFRGPVYNDPFSEHLTLTLQANDAISVDYNVFKDDKLIPQRTIGDDFPGRPAMVDGLGVPIIFGSVSDEGGSATGLIKVINVGNMVIGGTTYAAGLIAGHACKSVINLYQNGAVLTAYGTDVWAPGHGSWTTVSPSGALYITINGNWYTLVFFRNAVATSFQDDSQPVYANIQGVETAGDGTGTLITNLLTQYQYLLINWLLNPAYTNGPWLASPTFNFYPYSTTVADLVDTTSFTTASTVANTLLGGGFVGGFVIGANGQRLSIREIIQRANVSCNVLLRMDANSQLGVTMFNPVRTSFIGSTRTITDRRDILSSPAFNIQQKREWFVNDFAYQYANNYRDDGTGDWNGFNIQGHAPSKVKYGVVSGTRQYYFIRDTATADIVAAQQLLLGGADPPRIVMWAQSLCGLGFDVATGIPITHYNGLGANGWSANAVWILSQKFDPRRCVVEFTGFDVQPYMT